MEPWEVAVIGLLFVASITGSTVITLNMLLPISAPPVGVPICQTRTTP